MESAFDGYVGLDKPAAAWEIDGMKRDRRDARRPAPHAGFGLFLVLLVVAAAASAACRAPQVTEGVGGQSGDEGRRTQPSWLGTGGVAAVPLRP
jgi:hypothetical protein